MEWCATECLISVAHVLVRHRILIFVAKILWRTTHAPQNMNTGAPLMRFSLLVIACRSKNYHTGKPHKSTKQAHRIGHELVEIEL
jgi:hypothetical protein